MANGTVSQVESAGPFTQIVNRLDDGLEQLERTESMLQTTLNRLRMSPAPTAEKSAEPEVNTLTDVLERRARRVCEYSNLLAELSRELDDILR